MATGITVFDATVQKTHAWLGEICEQLDWKESDSFPAKQRAYNVLRAVLFALRDGVPTEEAAQLAGQMPMLVRGIFFESWKPSKHVRYKSAEEFYRSVAKNMGGANVVRPDAAAAAVITVLVTHVSAGEMADVVATLPREIGQLFIDAVASTSEGGPVEPTPA